MSSEAPASRLQLLLLVEDDPDVARLMTETLEERGYRVVTAPHGAAALRWLRQITPDLVIVDLQLPGMDGTALIVAVRETATPAPSILICSALPDCQAIAARMGVRHVLEKPFLNEDLLRMVQHALDEDAALTAARQRYTRPPVPGRET